MVTFLERHIAFLKVTKHEKLRNYQTLFSKQKKSTPKKAPSSCLEFSLKQAKPAIFFTTKKPLPKPALLPSSPQSFLRVHHDQALVSAR